MSVRRAVAMSFLAVACCSLMACKSGNTSAKGDSGQAPRQASMGVVNTKCPIVPSHALDPKVTREFQGKKVAFCCAGCVPAWDKMSDADKAAALKRAM
ncbi:MAG: hypothetical protein KF864_05005 [Phycisphaeraceae bacterium]|nr:hypothetical protein [Phycisphaeraceae bacterium]